MTGVVPVVPRLAFTDPVTGRRLAFGWLTVYLAGTTTLAATFQDAALTVANTNPIELDGYGECMFWVDSTARYKFLLEYPDRSTVPGWPVDNIPGVADTGAAVAAAQPYVDAAAASATSASSSASAAQGASTAIGVLPSNPTALPFEVTGISGGIGSGSGGTDGTYAGGVTGGPAGFQWTYTIAAGKLASYVIVNHGISTSNTAPTLSLPSGGLVAPTIPTATVGTIPVGRTFWGTTADNTRLMLWKNSAGALAPVNDASGVQITTFLAASVVSALGNYDPDLRSVLALMKSGGKNCVVYDTAVLSSLWKDTAGTIPAAAVGDLVLRIDDLSGHGVHMKWSNSDATLQKDAQGRWYVHVPNTGFINSFPTTVTLRANAYIAAAGSNYNGDRVGTFFGVQLDGANGVGLSYLTNGGVNSAGINKTGLTGKSLQTPVGSAPKGVPSVIDLYATPGNMSTWVNGSSVSHTESWATFDGGARNIATDWISTTTVAGAYVGVSSSGLSGMAAGCDFYGGIWIDDAIGLDLRKTVNRWLLRRASRLDILAQTYDVFLVFGQSNAMGNTGSTTGGPAVAVGQGAAWVNFGYANPMSDPVRQLHGNTALGGSAWPSFCNQWYIETGNPALVIGCAASGCGLLAPWTEGWWKPTGSGNLGLLEQSVPFINEALQYMTANGVAFRIRGVLWCGGENDTNGLAGGSFTKTQWKTEFLSLVSRTRTALNVSDLAFGIISSDRRTDAVDDAGYTTLRAAQSELCDGTNAGVYMVVPYQNFVGAGLMKAGDPVHWNQTAQNTVGTLAATNFATSLGM